jgi:hypothetical protein
LKIESSWLISHNKHHAEKILQGQISSNGNSCHEVFKAIQYFKTLATLVPYGPLNFMKTINCREFYISTSTTSLQAIPPWCILQSAAPANGKRLIYGMQLSNAQITFLMFQTAFQSTK